MKKAPKEPPSQAETMKAPQRTPSAEQEKRLLVALETARENVKPTVKRLMESESVSNDLLSMRLECVGSDDIRHR